MSSRMVKRLLKEQEGLGRKEEREDTDDEEEEESEERGQPAMNPFDLLNDEEDEGSAPEEDAEEPVASTSHSSDKMVDANKAGGIERNAESARSKGAASGSSSQSAKKKKSKKKGKGPGAAPTADPANDLDIDEVLSQSLQKLESPSAESAKKPVSQQQPQPALKTSILAVEAKHLRAEYELRRIFGAKVINQVEKDGDGLGFAVGGGMGGVRRRLGVVPRRGGVRGIIHPKTILVTPMDHWPRFDEGLYMDFLSSEGGCLRFNYMHTPAYAAVQRRFEACVSTHDPNTIAELLREHPYHVDSLFTLSDFYRQMGDHQTAAELVDRCLYALECAWHPMFQPTLGTCRLSFSWEPNRILFKILFRHMQHLGRRGCHRTTLNICRLLLSLDPDDPLGALFSIDFFALRAEQYSWLDSFVETYHDNLSLASFPNFAFSLALSAFFREREGRGGGASSGTSDGGGASSSRSPGTSAEVAGTGGERPSSSVLLQQALMLHPAVLPEIVAKAPVKTDADWNRILQHHVFASKQTGGASLEHLIAIYGERQSLLWRSSAVQAWLKLAAAAVVAKADGPDAHELKDWACVREQAFPPGTGNSYRHLRIADFSDNIAALPPDDAPHGPPHEVAGAPPVAEPYDLGNQQSMIAALLASLLPWVNLGIDLQGQDPPNAEGQGGREGPRDGNASDDEG